MSVCVYVCVCVCVTIYGRFAATCVYAHECSIVCALGLCV